MSQTSAARPTSPRSTLLFTAGFHACEYAGIEGATRLYKETKAEGLRGTLIVITCANLPGLRTRSPFVVPFDNKNLNRSFPGNPSGSPAEVIADILMKKFLPKVDYLVDCHDGDIGERISLTTWSIQTNDEKITEKSSALANAYGADYSYFRDYSSGDNGTFVAKANKAGVPAIIAEVGGDGRYEESDIMMHMRGLKNVMKYLGMIPGSIERQSGQARTTYCKSIISIKTGSTGIFNPLVELGERISRDQVLAEIKDLKGDVVEQVKAPKEVSVLTIMTKRVVNGGDTLFYAFDLDM